MIRIIDGVHLSDQDMGAFFRSAEIGRKTARILALAPLADTGGMPAIEGRVSGQPFKDVWSGNPDTDKFWLR